MAETHSSVLLTLAGIAFFMYGMTLASDSLQKLTANQTRDLISKLSDRPFLGVLLGIALTVMIQSSGAVTSMLVGLGSAGVISLRQVMSVILGAAVGTTFTVQIISLNIAQYGLAIFTVAFLVYFLTSHRTLKNAMGVFMGFGLIFWGLEVIGQGTEVLRHVSIFTDLLDDLKANPLFTLFVTAVFTAVVHSSAVTIGFAMTLAGSGLLTLTDSIYWVFGANIGTTATALMAATGGNYVGRQVAWAHCFYKVLSVVIFFPFAAELAELLQSTQVERSIANFHTVFNVLAVALFFPGVHYGAQLVEKLFPPSQAEKEFSPKYLSRGHWESTSVALAHAEREALRMGDIVNTMIKDSLELFRNEDPELEDSIRERDDKVDLLNKEIHLYITELMEEVQDPVTQKQMMRLMSFVADLESAADVVDNNIKDLARKKHRLKLEFSEEGWNDLEDLHREVFEVCELSLSCFQRRDAELASQVIEQKRVLRKREKTMRESHIQRLIQRKPETVNTSAIHIDVLGEYRRTVGIMANHVYSLVKDAGDSADKTKG